MLQKDIITTYVPGSPGQQSIAAVPARPAYCVTERITEQLFVVDRYRCVDASGNSSFEVTAQHVARVCVPAGGHYETRTRFVKTCHPAVGATPGQPAIPATPAQWLTNHNLGWNAGAHSVERHSGDCYVNFKVPAAAGVIVGFNNVSRNVGFNEIAHGIYFQSRVARVYESGAAKGEVLSFVPTDTFIIERVNGVVSYYRKAVGASPVRMYQSLTPSVGSVIVDASMYAGGDRID